MDFLVILVTMVLNFVVVFTMPRFFLWLAYYRHGYYRILEKRPLDDLIYYSGLVVSLAIIVSLWHVTGIYIDGGTR